MYNVNQSVFYSVSVHSQVILGAKQFNIIISRLYVNLSTKLNNFTIEVIPSV